MRWRVLLPLLGALLGCGLRAAEVIPPTPRNHFNDYAGLIPAGVSQALNAELAQFERDTSNQVVVAIYPKMQSDSSIEDYTVRVAQAWGVGQQGRKNGAVLFIFSSDRKLFISVGYGLEGVLPDVTANRIIREDVAPAFRDGRFAAGINAGVDRVIAVVGGGALPPAKPAGARWPFGGFNLDSYLFVLFVAIPVAGAVLRAMLGRVAGSVVGGGAVGAVVWFVAGSIFFGAIGGIVAFVVMLATGMGGGIAHRGGGSTSTGGWSGSSGGGSSGGGFSGGGGSSGGGGASGSW